MHSGLGEITSNSGEALYGDGGVSGVFEVPRLQSVGQQPTISRWWNIHLRVGWVWLDPENGTVYRVTG